MIVRSIHGSPASNARLRRRHLAETRLKIYGIVALGLAGLALVALLYSVFGKATLALSENYITLPVVVAEPDSANIGEADFDVLTKAAILQQFPNATSRNDKKQLGELLSDGAVFELRDRLQARRGFSGALDNEFLVSDTVDLYLKGQFGALDTRGHRGDLTVALDGEAVQVTSTEDDFAEALLRVRAGLSRQIDVLRAKAELQDKGVIEFTRRAAEASGDAQTKAGAEAAQRAVKRDNLRAQASALEARAATTDGSETLTDEVPSQLIKLGDNWIKLTEISANSGTGLLVGTGVDSAEFARDDWTYLVNAVPEKSRKISDKQIIWVETLRESGAVNSRFNWRFFSAGDSREPELAGIWGAAVGSFWTMLVTLILAFPTGVLAAIYLEEFAPKNRTTDFIEVNINNLAAVPSIVFGLLGLAFCLGFLGIPRSAPLAGGIVLALMTLPTIIITARTSVRAVPPSIRDAALGVGASKLQTSFHHVLPLAMPGILTGVIIGMARALGETAPLIMIGMVAFIVDIPTGITDSATVLPVQIYRWSDFPERAFEARTAAAICVLLVFLIAMNAVAVFLRNRFERRW